MADRIRVHRFVLSDVSDPARIQWIDALGVRVYFCGAQDGLVVVAVGKAGEAPADVEFAAPQGQGKTSQLQAYLDAIRAKGDAADWTGIGGLLDGVWKDPASPEVLGLPGQLAALCSLFDSKTPL